MDKDLRVVASLTTLPSRYEVLKQTLESLHKQTYKLDAIYLTIPNRARRLNKEYPPLPDDILSLCTVIKSDIDYGPITKIYGALVSEMEDNTVIISCDDDVLFETNHVETLIKHHQDYPNICITGTGALIGFGLIFLSIFSTIHPFRSWSGFTGFIVPDEGRNVDLVFGVSTVLYTRGMFPSNDKLEEELLQHSLDDDTIFHNDDVLISGYLSKQSIERRVFNDIPTICHVNGDDGLSSDLFKMITRMNESITKVKELGFFPVMEEFTIDETPTFRVIIVIIIIIIIIVLSIFFYNEL